MVTFNMDEYVQLPKDHSQSYHSFMYAGSTDVVVGGGGGGGGGGLTDVVVVWCFVVGGRICLNISI